MPRSMSRREERAIRNESLFREVNLNIEDLEARVAAQRMHLALVCECAERGCAEPIEVEAEIFHRVRKNPLQFVIAPGHEQLEVETVVERHPGFLIVEKHIDAA